MSGSVDVHFCKFEFRASARALACACFLIGEFRTTDTIGGMEKNSANQIAPLVGGFYLFSKF